MALQFLDRIKNYYYFKFDSKNESWNLKDDFKQSQENIILLKKKKQVTIITLFFILLFLQNLLNIFVVKGSFSCV